MSEVFICDTVRTPIGRYGGALASVRADDLAALPLKALMARHPALDWAAVEDVVLGCANQAGEDNRNVARMAALLAELPLAVGGSTVNRLCGSGMDAVAVAARTIKAGEGELLIAGGVESMSRAPFVLAKATSAFSRSAEIHDTTIGWRFVNKQMERRYGTDPLPQTAENVACEYGVSREDQDRFALWSQAKAAAAQADGRLAEEIAPVTIQERKGEPTVVGKDEHPRATSLDKLSQLKPLFEGGSVTAGNASGVNDGAAALLLASAAAAKRHGLVPLARVVGAATAGVAPRTMGMGPVPATQQLLARLGLSLGGMDIIELNEAFAAQALACTRELGLRDDDPRINPLGGAIALGHPLGMSGARLVASAVRQLRRVRGKRALCSMCIGVGQGIAMVVETV